MEWILWRRYLGAMSDVTRILSQIEQGDPNAAEQLLPLVYNELRKLAAVKLAHEKPGQTLQATALVHEAYLRLVGDGPTSKKWDSRGHFFSAAAEAMRRLLIESHRQKSTRKRGGGLQRVALNEAAGSPEESPFDLLALDDALQKLHHEDSVSAEIAKLRIFGGLSVDEAGQVLGIPHTTAYRQWTYAQTWLRVRLSDD